MSKARMSFDYSSAGRQPSVPACASPLPPAPAYLLPRMPKRRRVPNPPDQQLTLLPNDGPTPPIAYPAVDGQPPGYLPDESSSVHLSRTLMLVELGALFAAVPDADAPPETYRHAILVDNYLHKRSDSNRRSTFQFLRKLYTLDPANPAFRALRFYWDADEGARPLLGAVTAYLRDPAFRASSAFILGLTQFEPVTYQDIQDVLKEAFVDRFSPVSFTSMAQHIASSWSQTGHLDQESPKHRAHAHATPGAVAFALELAALAGVAPEQRFDTPYLGVLDCTLDRAVALAEDASHRGWLSVRRLGRVVSVNVTPR